MNQKTKQIIIAVVVIVVAFFAFKVFLGGGTSGGDSLIKDKKVEQFVDGQAIVALLNRLNAVTLDDSIFSNKVINKLQDFGQPIPDQTVGRPNPFAPIGIDGSGSVIRSTSTPRTR